MAENTRPDNYRTQAAQAKKLFLGYDQQELIRRCRLKYDETYFYTALLSFPYRIHRRSGDMERLEGETWVDGNSFNEVMTILDWLCDSKADRYITGRWVNLVSHGRYFHRELQEKADPDTVRFDSNPEGFEAACRALGGEKVPGADISYTLPMIDGLQVLVQLWHGDEEFPPNLRILWDENAERYLRYETTWYAAGLLLKRLKEYMHRE